MIDIILHFMSKNYIYLKTIGIIKISYVQQKNNCLKKPINLQFTINFEFEFAIAKS